MTARELPILMRNELALAAIEDRKTQTRRIVKPTPPSPEDVRAKSGDTFHYFTDDRTPGVFRVAGPVWAVRELGGPTEIRCPYGAPGDRLWVKESYWHRGSWLRRKNPKTGRMGWRWDGWAPKNDNANLYDIRRFEKPTSGIISSLGNRKVGQTVWLHRPSIYMYRWASRVTLEVVDVRVERIQDITDEDARAEGLPLPNPQPGRLRVTHLDGKVETSKVKVWEFTALGAFCHLWEGINGRGSWQSNPLVWRVEFKRVAKEAA